jgi:hypothetical protein
MEFQFELAWRENIPDPAGLAEALMSDAIIRVNPALRDPAALVDNIYRP